MNCAPGNFSPSMPINGMVPPSPIYIAGLPKNSWLAWSIAPSSHEMCIRDSYWVDKYVDATVGKLKSFYARTL